MATFLETLINAYVGSCIDAGGLGSSPEKDPENLFRWLDSDLIERFWQHHLIVDLVEDVTGIFRTVSNIYHGAVKYF